MKTDVLFGCNDSDSSCGDSNKSVAATSTDPAGSKHAGEPSSAMELEVERSTATSSAEEMTTEMPQPTAKRKVEPKDTKRQREEYVGKEMASLSSQHSFAADVVQLVDGPSRDQSD